MALPGVAGQSAQSDLSTKAKGGASRTSKSGIAIALKYPGLGLATEGLCPPKKGMIHGVDEATNLVRLIDKALDLLIGLQLIISPQKCT